jgi:hypothetical protein
LEEEKFGQNIKLLAHSGVSIFQVIYTLFSTTVEQKIRIVCFEIPEKFPLWANLSKRLLALQITV